MQLFFFPYFIDVAVPAHFSDDSFLTSRLSRERPARRRIKATLKLAERCGREGGETRTETSGQAAAALARERC